MLLGERTDEDVIAEAMRGDREAAGEYFARHLPFLTVMSRQIAGTSADPDDLLAEAVTAVLFRWFEGRGPAAHVNGYLIRAMRNRLVDEMRSPYRRALSLSTFAEPAVDELPEFHRADIHKELAFAHRALRLLPELHQRVLTATLIEGRKAGDLEEDLGRPVTAIYSLIKRAKYNLRRTMLRAMLEDHAPPECRRHASSLPEIVPDDLRQAKEAKGMTHIRGCARCRAVWSRFASIASALD